MKHLTHFNFERIEQIYMVIFSLKLMNLRNNFSLSVFHYKFFSFLILAWEVMLNNTYFIIVMIKNFKCIAILRIKPSSNTYKIFVVIDELILAYLIDSCLDYLSNFFPIAFNFHFLLAPLKQLVFYFEMVRYYHCPINLLL